jgi:hypothetical protein
MSEDKDELTIFEMADQFIEVANKLVQADKQNLGRVGAAVRYAAARFNAHEASAKTDDLAGAKDDAVDWYTEQFRLMLIENIDEHIEMQSNLNA